MVWLLKEEKEQPHDGRDEDSDEKKGVEAVRDASSAAHSTTNYASVRIEVNTVSSLVSRRVREAATKCRALCRSMAGGRYNLPLTDFTSLLHTPAE